MLEDSDKKLLLLKLSNDYTYNKAIAIVNKNTKTEDWHSVDDKNCFKTWDEVEAFINGICKGKTLILITATKKDKFGKLINFI